MKLGVIFCCYGNPEYVEPCLRPWMALKNTFNIRIAAVHGQFKEYHELGIEDNDGNTQAKLEIFREKGYLDFLYLQNDYLLKDKPKIYQTEAEIRNKGLQYLLEEKCDYVILLDSDEFYTTEQINSIVNYIQSDENSLYTWFSIPFKNYIFDGKQWISGFCPPRIFKVNAYPYYSLDSFYWDNDVKYKIGTSTLISYKDCASKSIQPNFIHGGIKHMTWLHSNGENKEKYQLKHFGGICSYKFDKEKGELVFNPDYYKDRPYPIIHKDE